MNRVFITGDTHGFLDLSKLNAKNFSTQKELTKEDFVIVVGDAGFLFDREERDVEILKWLQERPFTTLFIDGNHENFSKLNSYPITNWNGGNIHQLNDSVYHLMRGQVFHLCGHTFLTIGGGESIDKFLRKPNVTWFEEELPTYGECMKFDEKLEEIGWEVDYVLTHSIGDNLLREVIPYGDISHNILTNYLSVLDEKLSYKHWFFGHYHIDKEIDDKHTCLYQRVVEI